MGKHGGHHGIGSSYGGCLAGFVGLLVIVLAVLYFALERGWL